MTDNQHPYPVRPPAPGPCVILNLPKLWEAVQAEMGRRAITEIRQVSDITGVDRGTLGRIRKRALAGEIVEGQRGGISVNAYLTLVSFAHNGRSAAFGKELRGGVTAYTDPFDADRNASTGDSLAGDVSVRDRMGQGPHMVPVADTQE